MTLPNNKIFSNARTLTAFLDEKYANGTKINNLLTVCGNHIQKIRDTGNTINANIFQKALNEWAMNALLDEQFKEIGNAKLLNTIECNININDLNKEYNNKIRDIKIPLEDKKAIVDRWLINQAHSERAAEAIDFASKKLEHYDKLIDLRNKKLENTANTEINENNKNTSTHALTKQSIPQSRSFLYEASSTLYEKATSFVYISASSLLTTGQNLVQSCKDFGNSALKKLSNFI